MMPTVWTGCYSPGWAKEDLVGQAWAHPAKYSKQLIFRLVAHLVRSGYIHPGDFVCDPFAGVALGALPCLAHGLRWIGCELEAKFQATGEANLGLWHRRYGFSGATILQGDSRCLRQVLESADCCVASPPFCQSDGRKGGSDLYLAQRRQTGRNPESPSSNYGAKEPYGQTSGQLGALKPGTLADALCSSPPFAQSTQVNNNPADMAAGKALWKDGHDSAARVKQDYAPLATPGNLAGLPVGDCVVPSPPFGQALTGSGLSAAMRSERTYKVTTRLPGNLYQRAEQGSSQGQLANEGPTTFWSAASQIMAEVAAILKPHGIAVWVVKGYISKGKLVNFPAQWRQLCQAHGFELLEEIHASRIEAHGVQTELFGDDTVEETARMSFFRRLHTKKYPHLAIRHETVLILRKTA